MNLSLGKAPGHFGKLVNEAPTQRVAPCLEAGGCVPTSRCLHGACPASASGSAGFLSAVPHGLSHRASGHRGQRHGKVVIFQMNVSELTWLPFLEPLITATGRSHCVSPGFRFLSAARFAKWMCSTLAGGGRNLVLSLRIGKGCGV